MNCKVTILGAGAWGTALGVALSDRLDVMLWARTHDVTNEINHRHQLEHYLPGVDLPPALTATSDLSSALVGADFVLVAVPAQTVRTVLLQAKVHFPRDATLLSCAKGIEQKTGLRVCEIIRDEVAGHNVGVISGPSFAADVARGLPTAVTLAGDDLAQTLGWCQVLSGKGLRFYASDDVAGAELGGALKNVLAIAAGIVAGRELGASALAALTTRGFAEMSRVATALDARAETLHGLSGLGDLMLTCSSPKSRNFAYGMAIGRGDDLASLKLAEGVATSHIAAKIARDAGIDAPVISAVSAMLCGDLAVDAAIELLMSRPVRAE